MQDDLTSKIPFRDNMRNIRNLLLEVHQIDKSYYAINYSLTKMEFKR